MTPYSIQKENFPESLASSVSNETELLEVDVSDWESKMAELVGLKEEAFWDDSGVETEPREQEQIAQSPEPRTKESFSANPFAKLGLVGMGTLSIILFAGAFLSQMMNSGHQSPKTNPVVTAPPVPPKSESEVLSTEIESLKTKLALSDQMEAVKAAQQALRQDRGSGSTLGAVAKTRMQTIYVPRIVTVERIVKVSQPPVIVRQPSQIIRPKQEKVVSRIAILDRNHQNKVDSSPHVSAVATPAPTSPTVQQEIPPAIAPQKVENPIASPVPQPSLKPVAAGNSVKAILATAIFGETMMANGGNSNPDEKNAFVVRLQEPLKTVDGEIALPENTELLTEIRSLSEQGLLQLTVTKVLLQSNSNLTEITLPKNAITIHAMEGKPLIASQYPNQESSITGMDMGLFILGGLGKAAELFNRTESQVVTTSQAGSIVSNNNPQRNVLAGVMEGGMTSVVPQIAQRNQQAIAQMMQRTNIWFLPAGTEVEVYVNQLLQL